MDMASVAIIGTPGRFLAFICALTSLTSLTWACSQDFLDILGPGVRVKRGPDWKWGDQDGNGLGTVTTEITSTSWISVKWDNGHTNSYRVGHQDKCDLSIVGVLETQCNFFPTNMTDTGDFLLSFQDFPRPVHTQYRCHKHIHSADVTKVVALHVLMIDMCNTTIHDGANISSKLMTSGCMKVPVTYVSSGPDLFINTFKKLGTKYGFMAYVTYENKECEDKKTIHVGRNSRGFFTSPYSKFTLGSSILCNWHISTSEDQIIELTVTFFDDDGQLSVGDDIPLVTIYLRGPVANFTSTISSLTLRYAKPNKPSKGFQVLYRTKDKPKKAYCPTIMESLEPGKEGILTLPEYNMTNTGTLNCNWKLTSKSELSYINLTVTRLNSVPCSVHNDVLKVNGATFKSVGRCQLNTFEIDGQEININYTAKSPNNPIIILEYKTAPEEFCLLSRTIRVRENKGFLNVPSLFHWKNTTKCTWIFRSAEHLQISVEVLPQAQTEWEPYKAFKFIDTGNWMNMVERKITSTGNKITLVFDPSKQPHDFSGKTIVTYAAVSPAVTSPAVTSPAVTTPPVTTPSVTTPATTTLSVPTPAVPIVRTSTPSATQQIECTKPGVPVWCYVVLVLLSLACVVLFITSMTLYRRQIYVCDEHGSLLNLRLQDIIAKDDHM